MAARIAAKLVSDELASGALASRQPQPSGMSGGEGSTQTSSPSTDSQFQSNGQSSATGPQAREQTGSGVRSAMQ